MKSNRKDQRTKFVETKVEIGCWSQLHHRYRYKLRKLALKLNIERNKTVADKTRVHVYSQS